MLQTSWGNVSLGPITNQSLEEFRRLTTVIFPVKYQESFYQQSMQYGNLSRGAFLDGKLIGVIAVRLEAVPDSYHARLYIMTLGVLAPYRNQNIGASLLEYTLMAVQSDSNIMEAYLHVQTSNDGAIKFYKRFGFREGAVIPNYYRRLNPPDAVLLYRPLRT